MAAGAKDTNGIWLYGEDDPLSPFADLLNLGQKSVSDALAAQALIEPGKMIVTPFAMGAGVSAPAGGAAVPMTTPMAIPVLPNGQLLSLNFQTNFSPSSAVASVLIWTVVVTGGLTILGQSGKRVFSPALSAAVALDFFTVIRSAGTAGTVNLTATLATGSAATASCVAYGSATLS